MAFDWKKTLRQLAPVVASAIGGPWAGIAVNELGKALGIEGATEDDIAKAVASGDPNVYLKIKDAENSFILQMEKLGVERDKIHAANTDSARNLGIQRGLAAQWSISAIFVLTFGVVLYTILSPDYKMADGMKDVALILIGALITELSRVMNYWFGSTAGSKQKTDIMANIQK